MAHERFRVAFDDVLGEVLDEAREDAGEFAKFLDHDAIANAKANVSLNRAVVAIDQAIDASAQAVKQHGRILPDNVKLNGEAIAEARRQMTAIGLAFAIGMKIIERTAANFKAAQEAAEAIIERKLAERKRREDEAAAAALALLNPGAEDAKEPEPESPEPEPLAPASWDVEGLTPQTAETTTHVEASIGETPAQVPAAAESGDGQVGGKEDSDRQPRKAQRGPGGKDDRPVDP